MTKILVTGAAGFIGFHTAMHLKDVVGIDNFNNYYSPKLKRDRAKELAKANIAVIEGDINDRELLKKIINEHKITTIVHLAAQAGVRYSIEHPESYLKANVEGFLNILEVLRLFPKIKLIYASSSSVYGLNQKTPYSETDVTDQQASLYGVTKKMNELMARNYHHLYGLNVVGLRFFTVYGPWGRPDMAYFSFSEAINKGQKINLYNFGNCERDFTYIDDIVKGIVAAIEKGKAAQIYNLGNHQPVKLLEFVGILEKLWEKKAITELKPLAPGDVEKTYADIDLSSKELGFKPTTSLEEGLKKFVEWHKSYFSNNG